MNDIFSFLKQLEMTFLLNNMIRFGIGPFSKSSKIFLLSDREEFLKLNVPKHYSTSFHSSTTSE